MFIYNISLNRKKYFKIFCILVVILLIIMFCVGVYKICSKSAYFKLSDSVKNSDVVDIAPNNYTNILKAVHEDLDSYIGTKIHFTGYVYRVLDIKENEFILARNMIISSDYQAVVVGFLSSSEIAKDFSNDTWVEVTGEITKGDYHGDIPLLKITEIKETQKPNDEFVYPPDDNYIPTMRQLGQCKNVSTV